MVLRMLEEATQCFGEAGEKMSWEMPKQIQMLLGISVGVLEGMLWVLKKYHWWLDARPSSTSK